MKHKYAFGAFVGDNGRVLRLRNPMFLILAKALWTAVIGGVENQCSVVPVPQTSYKRFKTMFYHLGRGNETQIRVRSFCR